MQQQKCWKSMTMAHFYCVCRQTHRRQATGWSRWLKQASRVVWWITIACRACPAVCAQWAATKHTWYVAWCCNVSIPFTLFVYCLFWQSVKALIKSVPHLGQPLSRAQATDTVMVQLVPDNEPIGKGSSGTVYKVSVNRCKSVLSLFIDCCMQARIKDMDLVLAVKQLGAGASTDASKITAEMVCYLSFFFSYFIFNFLKLKTIAGHYVVDSISSKHCTVTWHGEFYSLIIIIIIFHFK